MTNLNNINHPPELFDVVVWPTPAPCPFEGEGTAPDVVVEPADKPPPLPPALAEVVVDVADDDVAAEPTP